MAEQIQRVMVWPPLLRLLHLLLAATLIILLLTGGLLHSGMVLNDRLRDVLLHVWHIPAGNVLAVVFLLRLVLLVLRKDVAGWKALIPENLEGIVNTARFYLSLGQLKLPGYFAHNPLWKLFYLVLFALLAVQIANGLLLESAYLRSVFHTDSVTVLPRHQLLFQPIAVLVFAHILTAILHDWKSSTTEISAMINGYKFFSVERSTPGTKLPGDTVTSVDLTDLLKTRPGEKTSWPGKDG